MPAYTPNFEYDVFISYAHVDNLHAPDERGWVERFEERLRLRLAPKVGRIGLVRVWRDNKLDGSQIFNDLIERRIQHSVVFVALNSKGYLESDYCKKELAAFRDHALKSSQGLRVGERSRLFNVLLTDRELHSWEDDASATPAFRFHDGEHNVARGSDDDPPAEPMKLNTDAFDRQIRSLADAILPILKGLGAGGQALPQPTPALTGDVYLADTSDGLHGLLERLSADLEQKGQRVIAGIPPPYEADVHAAYVKTGVERARLSVHLLDDLAGRLIQGASTTYPRAQFDIASLTSTAQLVWLPPSADMEAITDTSHLSFLKELEHGTRTIKQYEFVRSPRERLAAIILEKLHRLEEARRAPASEPGASVLLDWHLKDQKAGFELGVLFSEWGLQPFIHQETDDPATGIIAFAQQLARVRKLVVFFGQVAQAWMEERINSAIQFVSGQRARDLTPLLDVCYLYLLPPAKFQPTFDSRVLRIEVIDNSRSDRIDPDAVRLLFQ